MTTAKDSSQVVVNVSGAHQESIYSRIMRTRTIRCGYTIWEPFLTKDTEGKLSGIYYDYTEALGQALGLKIEWTEETSFGPHVEGLKTGRFDMMCAGDWPSAARSQYIDYPDPILYVAIMPYVREGDHRFDGRVEAINDAAVKIAAVDGSTPFIIAHHLFPQAQKVTFPELTPLSTPMADVAFWSRPNAASYMAKNPGTMREVALDKPIRLFASSLAVRKGEDDFRQMITFATRELMQSGFVDKIISKYEPAPNSLYRVAPPYEEKNSSPRQKPFAPKQATAKCLNVETQATRYDHVA